MQLGIDVGGTHTDAVAIDERGIRAAAKVRTDHDNLLSSIRAALKIVLSKVNPEGVVRLNLSTTLSTNSIVEGKIEDVGVVVSSGPGIDPENYRIGRYFFMIDGSIDHRGTKIQELGQEALQAAMDRMQEAGVRVYAVVGKFSTRNPEHEDLMRKAVPAGADFITRGHTLSGVLNFPRRVATAYFNSAVWRIYNDFAWAVEESAAEFGIEAEINILKADGGTMPLAVSKDLPVESILSGPAASVMGIIALCDINEDSIILDIGGTTTDIAVFADGSPIIENEGMTVGSYPTLVRSLKVRSIGVGGDSTIRVLDGRVVVGPDRHGPALAMNTGEGPPALTDALNYVGLADFGNRGASVKGIEALAARTGFEASELATQAVNVALKQIRDAAEDLLDEINDKPVYTIHEILKGRKVIPQRVYIMGGPAGAMNERLAETFDLDVVLSPHYSYANAIGAALTWTTMETLLFADTKKGILIVPNLDIRQEISRSYNLEQAKVDACNILSSHLKSLGVNDLAEIPEIIEAESFNMVEGPQATGKNIRVRCQIRPGVGKVSL